MDMREFPRSKNYEQIDLLQLGEPFRTSLANKLEELKKQDKEVWILFFKNGADKPSAAKLKLVSSIDDFVADLWGSINIEKIQFGAGRPVPRVMIYIKNEK